MSQEPTGKFSSPRPLPEGVSTALFSAGSAMTQVPSTARSGKTVASAHQPRPSSPIQSTPASNPLGRPTSATPRAARRSWAHARLAEPGYRVGQPLCGRARLVAQFARRLGRGEEHAVARHAQAVAGKERLATGEIGPTLGEKCDRTKHGDRNLHLGRASSGDLGDDPQYLGQHQIIAAE